MYSKIPTQNQKEVRVRGEEGEGGKEERERNSAIERTLPTH
jgi:hypothetical protein